MGKYAASSGLHVRTSVKASSNSASGLTGGMPGRGGGGRAREGGRAWSGERRPRGSGRAVQDSRPRPPIGAAMRACVRHGRRHRARGAAGARARGAGGRAPTHLPPRAARRGRRRRRRRRCRCRRGCSPAATRSDCTRSPPPLRRGRAPGSARRGAGGVEEPARGPGRAAPPRGAFSRPWRPIRRRAGRWGGAWDLMGTLPGEKRRLSREVWGSRFDLRCVTAVGKTAPDPEQRMAAPAGARRCCVRARRPPPTDGHAAGRPPTHPAALRRPRVRRRGSRRVVHGAPLGPAAAAARIVRAVNRRSNLWDEGLL
jgi:hypothetical protein